MFGSFCLFFPSNSCTFAVINYADDTLEAYKVNSEALNNPISKQKLTSSNIKSSVAVYKIEKGKLRKIFVYQSLRSYNLYDQGPILGVWVNYNIQDDNDHLDGNIIKIKRALLLLSWKTHKPLWDPLEAPEHLLWSPDWKYWVMWFNEYLGIYSLNDNVNLIKKYYLRANHWKFFDDFLFIATDDGIYCIIISLEDSPIYEVASSLLLYRDPTAKYEAVTEETKEISNENRKISSLPPFAIKFLALLKNLLVIQQCNGDISWLEIKNEYLNYAFKLKSNKEERIEVISILEAHKDYQKELYRLIQWAKMESLVNYDEISIPTKVNQYNYLHLLDKIDPLKLIHSLIKDDSIEKFDKITILESIFHKYIELNIPKGALLAAIGLNNKEYLAQALTAQDRTKEATYITEKIKESNSLNEEAPPKSAIYDEFLQ